MLTLLVEFFCIDHSEFYRFVVVFVVVDGVVSCVDDGHFLPH